MRLQHGSSARVLSLPAALGLWQKPFSCDFLHLRSSFFARLRRAAIALIACASALTAAYGHGAMDPYKARVIEYWTIERRAQAIPRDLVIDSRGLGYLKRPDGSLSPHGHSVAALAQDQSPRAGPGGDSTPPAVSEMIPGANATIGTA